jgi:hypothetical protein
LGLHLGEGLTAVLLGGALTELNEFCAAGVGTFALEGLVHGSFADGELVDGELRVVGHVGRARCLFAGLEVDYVGAAFGVRSTRSMEPRMRTS